MSLINWFYLEDSSENIFWETEGEMIEKGKKISDILFLYIYEMYLCKDLGCIKAL